VRITAEGLGAVHPVTEIAAIRIARTLLCTHLEITACRSFARTAQLVSFLRVEAVHHVTVRLRFRQNCAVKLPPRRTCVSLESVDCGAHRFFSPRGVELDHSTEQTFGAVHHPSACALTIGRVGGTEVVAQLEGEHCKNVRIDLRESHVESCLTRSAHPRHTNVVAASTTASEEVCVRFVRQIITRFYEVQLVP